MEYYILIYKVIVDNKKQYLGKAAVVDQHDSKSILELKSIVIEGYRKAFPEAKIFTVIIIKATLITFAQYAAFAEKIHAKYN